LRSLYPENEIIDEEEEDWLEHLNVARSRGKGTPKKKRTAAGKSRSRVDCNRMLIDSRIQKVQQAKVDDRVHINGTKHWVEVNIMYKVEMYTGITRSLCSCCYTLFVISYSSLLFLLSSILCRTHHPKGSVLPNAPAVSGHLLCGARLYSTLSCRRGSSLEVNVRSQCMSHMQFVQGTLLLSPRIMAICLPAPTTLLFSLTLVPIGTALK
jgi:hypothetical protein